MGLENQGSAWRAAAAAQGALAVVALLVLAFAPPAQGRTLLVPVSGNAIPAETLDKLMLTRIAPGPLPGSVIVEGEGRALARPLFDQGILMLAAPAALCRVADESGGEA